MSINESSGIVYRVYKMTRGNYRVKLPNAKILSNVIVNERYRH